jgi:hypothetical protein
MHGLPPLHAAHAWASAAHAPVGESWIVPLEVQE